jgi:hypothetical protein
MHGHLNIKYCVLFVTLMNTYEADPGGRAFGGIAGSNLTGVMDVCLW